MVIMNSNGQRPAHAVPLASAFGKRPLAPKNPRGNLAGHSPERGVEGW